MSIEAEVQESYRQLSILTAPICAAKCKSPHSCCSPEYCGIAIEYAKERWGVDLQITDHPTLPLMGPHGCIAEPHLRPLCTAHTCEIYSRGYVQDDPQWTNQYFALRDRVSELEYQLDGERQNASH